MPNTQTIRKILTALGPRAHGCLATDVSFLGLAHLTEIDKLDSQPTRR